jgi:glycosyltransferase involved in cell wall biosynthesis
MEQPVRILFLGQFFNPEPGLKGLSFVKELVSRGHQVQVLTGFPNYPGGKVYPGYRIRLWQREVMDGVEVIRVPLYPSHDQSRIGRVANYASFALAAALLGPFLVKQADVAYVYHPPATIGLPAMALKYLRGIPVVIDIQDLWPDTLAATGMVGSPFVLKLVGLWCKWVYRALDRIVVLSEGFRTRLAERGVDPARVTVIRNWCDESEIKGGVSQMEAEEEAIMSGRFNFLFAGNIGLAQGLDVLLDAAVLARDLDPRIQIILVGAGLDLARIQQRILAEGLDNVRCFPGRHPSRIGCLMAKADVLLVHLKDDPLFTITIPSKTQAYLAVGRPVLAVVPGECAKLVLQAGAGMVCDPGNPRLLAEAMVRMAALDPEQLEAMGRSGKAYYDRELCMAKGVEQFEAVFQELLAGQTLA